MPEAITPAWVETLHNLPGTIVSAATETIQLYPLAGQVPNLCLVTAFRHSWIKEWRKINLPVFCLQEHSELDTVSTRGLLQHQATLKFLQSLKPPVRILVFKPSADLDRFFRENGFESLNAPAAVSRPLENKLKLPEIAEAAGLNSPPHTIITLEQGLNTAELLQQFGNKAILQTAKGFSGNRTYRIERGVDLERLIQEYTGRRCKMTRIIPGNTWTANACVTASGHVVTSQPFMQLTFESEQLGGLPPGIGSRGNLFVSPQHIAAKEITDAMVRIGRILFPKKFRGIFGADFVVESRTDRLFLIEINPRLVASIPALTPMQIATGSTPLLAHHIAALCGTDIPMNPKFIETMTLGGQLILKEKIRSDDEVFRVHGSGFYRLDESGHPAWTGPGWSPAECPEGAFMIWMPERATPTPQEYLRVIVNSKFIP